MILIRPQKVKEWLRSIEKDQNWLAAEIGIKKSYLSLTLHNRTKISRNVMDKILTLSRIPYESLFYVSNEVDSRQFYGKDIWFRNKLISSFQYNLWIEKILDDNPAKNGTKPHNQNNL